MAQKYTKLKNKAEFNNLKWGIIKGTASVGAFALTTKFVSSSLFGDEESEVDDESEIDAEVETDVEAEVDTEVEDELEVPSDEVEKSTAKVF